MAYRTTRLRTVVADGSDLSQVEFDRTITVNQTYDNQVFSTVKQVKPTDTEVQVPITPVTTGYFVEIRSDYPVMVRLNGVSATQFTLHGSNVVPVSLGAPLPDQSYFSATMTITSLYVAPIAGAQTTANVRVLITGDPLNPYV